MLIKRFTLYGGAISNRIKQQQRFMVDLLSSNSLATTLATVRHACTYSDGDGGLI